MATRHETSTYALDQLPFGSFLLRRLGDGHEAFFQGEDADLWESNMTAIEGIKNWSPNNSFDQSFNFLCSGYDDILRPPVSTR